MIAPGSETPLPQEMEAHPSTDTRGNPKIADENSSETHLGVEAAYDDNVANIPTDGDTSADDAASEVSMTSTIEYTQEPYETFKDKCLELMFQTFKDRTAHDIKIERMVGGGFNRVIGVTLHDPEKPRDFASKDLEELFMKYFGAPIEKPRSDEEYILRIPRFSCDAVEIPYHVATLGFISGRLDCAVPAMIAHDVSEDNPLGSGYSLQRRLPGSSLFQLWETLTFEQKKNAVRGISRVTIDITNITHRCAGIISPSNNTSDLKGTPKLETLPVPAITIDPEPSAKPKTSPAEPQTTKDFLIGQCERWREYEQVLYDESNDDIWDGFIQVINKIDELGFLPIEDKFHFCHLDLQPRNVLVEVNGDEVDITGLLDWDSAVFAPKFMAKRAPFWLWQNDEGEDNDEVDALRVPELEEDAEFKKVFEETVDAEFLRYAYSQEYIFARRIFHVLHHGISSNWELDAAHNIVDDFAKLYTIFD
jgi:aminoglycoside phosphotransferase (APT) family kinase protein